ncbi:hypothetical protein G6F35_011946 [Rhizopus arrhizus]|nr:hypothetical protein G6F35_011946 [Rhizopus arrhizus]
MASSRGSYRVYDYDAAGRETLSFVCWRYEVSTNKPYAHFPWWEPDPRPKRSREAELQYARTQGGTRCGTPDGKMSVEGMGQVKKLMETKYGFGTTKLGAGLLEQATLARGMELTALSNPLVAAIAARIRRAIVAGQGFHVYITLPVHPEGSLFDGAVLKQQYWVQQTLLRGDDSLIRRICRSLIARDKDIREVSVEEADLQAEVKAGRWKEYLSVMNLRSYGVLADVNHKNHYAPHTIGADQATPLYVVTEQCYVHSKLLIVDDAVTPRSPQ